LGRVLPRGTRSARPVRSASFNRVANSPPGLQVQGLGDGLVRYPYRLAIGMVDPQPASNLLQRPVPRQHGRDRVVQPPVGFELTTRRSPRRPFGALGPRDAPGSSTGHHCG